jgi:hypothetical protein
LEYETFVQTFVFFSFCCLSLIVSALLAVFASD